MARYLHLLRHGETAAQGRLIGSTDIEVAEDGYGQLQRTAKRLGRLGISFLATSPLQRCLQSRDALELAVQSVIWDELREIDFGAWENLRFAEIARRWPDTVDLWSSGSTEFTFPNGENIGDFAARMRALRQRIDRCASENLLLVTHGGVIRYLICLYLGIGLDNYLLFDVKPGCFSTLALHSEGGVLVALNCGWSD
ncbi:MAG: histidine phosphatase family protein [Desulfopila sp.]